MLTRAPKTMMCDVVGHVYGGGSDEAFVGNVDDVVNQLPETQQRAAGLPLVITEWSSSWMCV